MNMTDKSTIINISDSHLFSSFHQLQSNTVMWPNERQ